MKASTKIKIPIKVNTRALITLAIGTSILFPSCVVVIETVNGTIRTGIIADGVGNVFQLVHRRHAPAAILRESRGAENQEAVNQIEFAKHQLFSVRMMGAGG